MPYLHPLKLVTPLSFLNDKQIKFLITLFSLNLENYFKDLPYNRKSIKNFLNTIQKFFLNICLQICTIKCFINFYKT